MKAQHLIVAAILGLVLLLGGYARADVSGKWEGEVDTLLGRMKYTFDLQSKAGGLTGKVTRMTADNPTGMTTDIIEGKVNGDEVSIVEVVDLGGEQFRVKFNGPVSGDEMKLTRDVGEYGKQQFTAKQIKAALPAIAPTPK